MVARLQALADRIDHDRNSLAANTAQVEEYFARTLGVMQRGKQVGLAEISRSWCQQFIHGVAEPKRLRAPDQDKELPVHPHDVPHRVRDHHRARDVINRQHVPPSRFRSR